MINFGLEFIKGQLKLEWRGILFVLKKISSLIGHLGCVWYEGKCFPRKYFPGKQVDVGLIFSCLVVE